MRRDGFIGNTRYTNQILKIDTAYVESISKNYFGDNLKMNAEKVLNSYYPKPEFTCYLCGAGNRKRHNRPACFYPTQAGYVYACVNCEPSLTLYQFLNQLNPEVAKNYQFDRWVNKLTGQGFNAPDPPKKAKAEFYKQKELELKEKNKLAYERKHGLTND